LGSAISVLIFVCAGFIALIYIKVFGAYQSPSAPGGAADGL
jgi:multiple sugar transport system permease protein